jgi:hypothetical protein
MREVRREDGELCGYVAEAEDRWRALAVFGAPLGDHATEQGAEADVRTRGLAVLGELWTLVDGESGDEQHVRIQQASPSEVTVALDVYSLPGVPTRTLSVEDLAGGRWRLEPPPA